ncbi:MAG: AAA family ATPase [Lachnospiraceae bacterium]|nr:AAA family ATPase [Lachnospiraceae bacterium]
MSAEDNKLYKLIRYFSSTMPEGVPETVLHGCAKLLELSEESLLLILKNNGIEDPESITEVKDKIASGHKAMDELNLDEKILCSGLGVIKKSLAYCPEEFVNKEYLVKISEYDQETTINRIISDALEALPEKEKALFTQSSTMKEIFNYNNDLRKKIEDSHPNNDPRGDIGEVDNITSNRQDQSHGGNNCQFEDIDSEVMKDYLAELRQMIIEAKNSDAIEYLWSTALLISIDKGGGLTHFLKKIAGEYINCGSAIESDPAKLCSEILVQNDKDIDKKYSDWEKAERVFSAVTENPHEKLSGIICLDISEWMGEIGSSKVKEYVHKIMTIGAPVSVVFRVPFMEMQTVADLEAELSDVIPVRSITVEMPHHKQLIDYLYDKAKNNSFTITEDCRDTIEKCIIAEKNDGYFYGYKTMDKVFNTIAYEKIRYNATGKIHDKTITDDQLRSFVKLSEGDLTADEELDRLIGMEDVKKQIREVIKQIQVQQELVKQGQEVERPSIHMMFTGAPGTGKTTVARITAKLMKETGILSKGYMREIKGRDLCGRYIGETTPKTTATCREAYGSVLFIDEAYELYRSDDNSRDYGREAITALIAEMENHRDDMCVILAGYEEDMDKLMEANDGIRDRIPIKIKFPNYSREELEKIFYYMLDDKFELDRQVKKTIHEHFCALDDELLNSDTFSNARFVRNLFERVWGQASSHYDQKQGGKLKISKTDFISVKDRFDNSQHSSAKRRRIGF